MNTSELQNDIKAILPALADKIQGDPSADRLICIYSINVKLVNTVDAKTLMMSCIRSLMKRLGFHASISNRNDFDGEYISRDKREKITACYIPEEKLYGVIGDFYLPEYMGIKSPFGRIEYYYSPLNNILTTNFNALDMQAAAFNSINVIFQLGGMSDDFIVDLSESGKIASVNGMLKKDTVYAINTDNDFSLFRKIFTGNGENDALTIYIPKLSHYIYPIDIDLLEDYFEGIAVIATEEDAEYAEKFAKAMIRAGVYSEEDKENILVSYGKQVEKFNVCKYKDPETALDQLDSMIMQHYSAMYPQNMNYDKFMALKKKCDEEREKRKKMLEQLEGNEIYSALKSDFEKQKKATADAEAKVREAEKKAKKLEADNAKLKEQADRAVGQIEFANKEKNKIQKKLDEAVRTKEALEAEKEKEKADAPDSDRIAELEQKLADREKELYDAKNDIETFKALLSENKPDDNAGSTLLVRGNEKDIYPNEIRDMVLECLAEAKTDEIAVRRNDVINDILQENHYNGSLKGIRKSVRDALGSASTGAEIVNGLQPIADKLNMKLMATSKHRKIMFNGDKRYLVVAPSTPSDAESSGRNLAATIIKKML